MINLVLTLVFSIVMLVFMAFPAMKIVEWIERKIDVPKRWHNVLLIGMVILLSLLVGIFLKFA